MADLRRFEENNILTPSAPTVASVGITSAQIVAANTSRSGLVLINTSSNRTISLGLGATAVAGSGIVLYPGGAWTMDDFTVTTAAINAIASGAGASISVQEFN